jgi:hypothetical protein
MIAVSLLQADSADPSLAFFFLVTSARRSCSATTGVSPCPLPSSLSQHIIGKGTDVMHSQAGPVHVVSQGGEKPIVPLARFGASLVGYQMGLSHGGDLIALSMDGDCVSSSCDHLKLCPITSQLRLSHAAACIYGTTKSNFS